MPNKLYQVPDQIHIEQLEVLTRIGVPEEERANPQKLTVSISLWPYQKADNLIDNIEQTVNYSAVAEETKNFVRDQSLNLIETLADRLAMPFTEKVSDSEGDDRSAEISSAGCKIRFRQCHSNCVCRFMMRHNWLAT